MPFEFKPITRTIDLAQYDAAYEGARFEVWVNMPRAKMTEWYTLKIETIDLIKEIQATPSTEQSELIARGEKFIVLNDRLCEWFAEAWSKGTEVWTSERVKELMEHLLDTDPQAWIWIVNETQRAISDHREGNRKN